MIKRILIPLDASPYTDSGLEIATTIAKLNQAELTGLVVMDLPGIDKSIGPVPLGGLYYAEKAQKAKRKEAEKRVQELLTKFRAKCEKAGIIHREAEQQGSPSERIIQESIFYDAVIMGMRTFYNFENLDSPDDSGDSLEDILDETITPIYAVPKNMIFPKIPQERMRVVIAFDGSLPAARAMQRFAQLIPQGVFEILLLTSEDEKEKAYYLLDQAENYLRCQEFEHIEKKWITDNIIDAISNTYLDWAHLVVLGAHSKKGVFDFMVGSLTRYLIKAARKPILIAQ